MKFDPSGVTVQTCLNGRLQRLDAAWKTLRAIHADIEHCNEASKDHKAAMEALESAFRAVWRLKAAWSDEQ